MPPVRQASQDPDSQAPDSGSSSTPHEASRFTFVVGGHQASTRSHAMRVHWSERHRVRREKRQREASRRLYPTLAARETLPIRQSSHSSSSDSQEPPPPATTPRRPPSTRDPSIAAQLLIGFNHALSTVPLDPFDSFPIRLTSKHHKLIHHWLTTHATMMFETIPAPSFNPMRDVWFPLDLSNPASFNAIMAHSAAHLAHYYGATTPTQGTNSIEALRFKADAVKILSQWLNDPDKALSNDAFAAVVRLLTFERYWGTEAEWKVHRNGLQRMIHARGGLHQLHSDWRLELVVGLVSLMSKPTWFECTNDLSEISDQRLPTQSILGSSIDLHKIRCLWLISFIQDMRNLMSMWSRLYHSGLHFFPSLYDAILLIRAEFEFESESEGEYTRAAYRACDYERLTCLFAICILVQGSVSQTYSGPHNALTILDMALEMGRWEWEGSVRDLYGFLRGHFVQVYPGGERTFEYVVKMTDVVGHLSLEAHQGIEKCLLNMLGRTRGGGMSGWGVDGGTPDELLSMVHGY
ncbi:uncharacterized protein BO80DRAFT_413128 [Aspergillus ibericus CBS 121593]|uniref:Tachykinin family protein n=1 Tax=Aspergillus ibericus CBS 121593 TaxID=1448316 RepID=A0A395GR98_9EURO|nr:hypothetical protein BO80DRAFT_413128 [Aspergillus ibericus CBS 121593]RAK98065.1 hypothetical protein BO80DRAFT_413128 [Aspergillus ibericus CBS 121593]